MYIPYPTVGLSTITCEIAPTILPFWIIGLPLIPCIIPPVSFNNAEIKNEVEYSIRTCSSSGCFFETEKKSVGETAKILSISFASETWEAKNMIDFLTQYGKLKYRDSNDGEFVIDIVNLIDKMYYGKTVFIKVPVEIETAKEVYLDLVVRDNHYVYKII